MPNNVSYQEKLNIYKNIFIILKKKVIQLACLLILFFR